MATKYPKSGKGRKWTIKELENIPVDWSGSTLNDGDGLTAEVRLNNSEIALVFRYAFKWEQRVCRFYCGSWPTVPLEEIRKRRDSARSLVKSGINPNDHKQASRIEAQAEVASAIREATKQAVQDLTLEQLFQAWIEDGVARLDGNKEIKRSFNKDVLPKLGQKAVRLITEQDLLAILRSLIKRGVVRLAVRLYNDVVQMFSWAEKRQPWRKLLADGNPAVLISIKTLLPAEYVEERARTLSREEIQELHRHFLTSTSEYASTPKGSKYSTARPLKRTSQLALWICLSTTCRIGELLMAEWKHLDLEGGTWFIPKENVKATRGKKQDLHISLSKFALGNFKALHELTGQDKGSRWCFPAKHNDSHVCLKSVSKQVGDRQTRFKNRTKPLTHRSEDNSLVLSKGDLGEWTPHDLRRTAATMMQSLGINLDVIDRCQNHVLAGSKVRRHYMHHSYAEEMKSAWAQLGSRLELILAEA